MYNVRKIQAFFPRTNSNTNYSCPVSPVHHPSISFGIINKYTPMQTVQMQYSLLYKAPFPQNNWSAFSLCCLPTRILSCFKCTILPGDIPVSPESFPYHYTLLSHCNTYFTLLTNYYCALFSYSKTFLSSFSSRKKNWNAHYSHHQHIIIIITNISTIYIFIFAV